jgi:hypothetical protein
MNERAPLELTEDRVPAAGMEAAVRELVELYGGEMTAERERARDFALPLRRGNPAAGAIECTLTWAPDAAFGGNPQTATLHLTASRDLDAPKAQRVLFLVAGVVGAVLFMLWPFFPHESQFGTLGALGGVIAITVYLITLRKTSGGIAADFLQRLAKHQRGDPR